MKESKKREEKHQRLEPQEHEKQARIQDLSPLPQRSRPRSWEDLASVLSHTARRMGYEDPT